MTAELLRALTKAGNYAVGAFDGTDLVGACVGFFGPPRQRTMHSHIAGVAAATAGRSVGFAMKVHQRAWAMRHGITAIGWTFDPLVRRNVYFNVAKLAAAPTDYLTNFYGGMHDSINGTDDSDRLLIRWDLYDPTVTAACGGAARHSDVRAQVARGAVIGLGRGDDGAPVAGSLDGDTVLVAVPDDIEALRVSDPGRAKEWRVAVRDALTPLLARGARVTGFDKTGWYVLTTEGNLP
jgi:predicted GNAT superfamily acetyltransferase